MIPRASCREGGDGGTGQARRVGPGGWREGNLYGPAHARARAHAPGPGGKQGGRLPVAASASALQGLFDDALSHHRAGRLAEAEELYRRVLAADARHAAALQLLGVIALQGGRHGDAVALIGRAIDLQGNDPVFHLHLGLALKGQGRLDEAVASYDRALGLRPDFAEAHLNRSVALRAAGRVEAALAACERSLACRPDFAGAHANRGDLLRDLGRPGEAVASYDRALALDPAMATAHFGRGHALLSLGNPAEAIASFDRALARDAGFADCHAGRADALYRLRRLAEALAGYDRALALRADFTAVHHNRGNVLNELGRPDEAVASFDRALALQPGLAESHYNRANVLRARGALELAIAGYDRVIALRPELADAHYYRGTSLYTLGRHDEAIESYDRALALRPDLAVAHLDRATAVKNRGLLDEAIASYDRALALGANYALAHAGRAEALYRQGRLEQALAGYDDALALDPAFALAHHGRASVLADLRRPEDALASYDRALELAPGVADTHNNRANVLLGLGRNEQAIEGYDRAIELRPDFALAHNNRGNAFQNLGKLDEAIACYDRAIELSPDQAAPHCFRGNALSMQRKFDEAIACYDRAIALMPDYAPSHFFRGNALSLEEKYVDAVVSYDRAIAVKADYAAAHCNRGIALRNLALAGAAAESFERARALEPLSFEYAVLARLTLPIIMPLAGEIADRRARYRQGVAELMAFEGKLESLDTVNTSHLFYLAYNGLDDRPLLEEVGALLRAKAPALAFEAPHIAGWRPPEAGRRIRIGFASEYFRNHTIERLYRGLIRHLDRARFEVVVIHSPRGARDDVSERLDAIVDRVVHLPQSLALQHEAVAGQCLDVLFYPDIGMSRDMYYLAFARLAPVQAVSWGHPNTTGLDSIDYFVSADGVEPAGAERHYSERLVRLGRLPCFYDRPDLPEAIPSRQELGLPESGTLYGCPQSLFKFHPEFDAVLAEIAAGDPTGHIVVMQGLHPPWIDVLRQRWAQSHPALPDRVVVLRHQHPQRFVALLSVLDVLLDPIHFGSGNTLYEAMASGTPIVTWPGRHMRGRIVAGAYRQMGVAEAPIAEAVEDYAPLALALGRDPERRARLRRALVDASPALFADHRAVREFETFVDAAVGAAGRRARLPAGWQPQEQVSTPA